MLLVAASSLQAWGERGHRAVTALALKSLPESLDPWFKGREADVMDHASDPDHWRQDRKEGPRHYMDMEPYGGPASLPRTLEAARQQAGGDFYRLGVVPWIIQDRWRDLVDAFQQGDAARVTFATAVMGHYIADAHVPLHTTKHHDGQATNQRGVHSRWETGLVERYIQPEALACPPAQADPAFLARPWEWLGASHALIPQLLEDDRDADRTTPMTGRGWVRTQAYWMIFRARQIPVVQQQLQLAGKHLGDAVLSAWIEAGRPAAPRGDTRRQQGQ